MPSDKKLGTFPHLIVPDDMGWDPKKIEMRGNNPQDERNFIKVVNGKRNRAKADGTTIKNNQVLGSICDSLVPGKAVEGTILDVNIKSVDARGSKGRVNHGKRTIAKVIANARHSVVTPAHVAGWLNIGSNEAKQMLKCTKQNGVRIAVHPISRRY